jgi:hypothetical protein
MVGSPRDNKTRPGVCEGKSKIRTQTVGASNLMHQEGDNEARFVCCSRTGTTAVPTHHNNQQRVKQTCYRLSVSSRKQFDFIMTERSGPRKQFDFIMTERSRSQKKGLTSYYQYEV